MKMDWSVLLAFLCGRHGPIFVTQGLNHQIWVNAIINYQKPKEFWGLTTIAKDVFLITIVTEALDASLMQLGLG